MADVWAEGLAGSNTSLLFRLGGKKTRKSWGGFLQKTTAEVKGRWCSAKVATLSVVNSGLTSP